MILTELEQQGPADDGEAIEVVPARNLTLEHIMPVNPSEDWQPLFDADPELPGLVSRLGNLCLLDEAMGREAGSKGFETKVSYYKASRLRVRHRIDGAM